MSETVVLGAIGNADLDAAQQVFDATPAYHRMVMGGPPPADMARRCLEREPPKPKKGVRVFKRFMGIRRAESDRELAGVLDLLVGYPGYHIATIATLIVRESEQRQGIGLATIDTLRRWLGVHHPVVEWLDCSITDDNLQATRFLIKAGFERTNSWHEVEVDGRKKRVIRLEQRIKAAPG